MSDTFGAAYAQQYDLLYQDKNYDAEVALLERLFQRHELQGNTVLDLGCGTGQHATRLARRGFEVTGVDRSPEMLRIARVKAEQSLDELSPQPSFVEGDITSVRLGGEPFDVALMMFAVLGYQVGNADVRAALANARRHLRPGGVLFCDFWYGPAVLAERPSERVKVIDTPQGQVIRVASGELDTLKNLCTVGYRVWRIEAGRLVSEVRERHPMRYFFAPELDLFLAQAGLQPVRVGAFPNLDAAPTETTWNAALVARAI
jgi:SAM-dependent methyltransferase